MITKDKVNLGKGIYLERVHIPEGIFTMGSPEDEKGRYYDEGPQHKVTLKPFYMSKYPITQEQYQLIVGKNPSYFTGKNRPVEGVSWNNATEFCRKLSEITGVTYSLPSESQWEYACRAGTTTPFYFGEKINPKLANYKGHYVNVPHGFNRDKTTEVGSFSPNSFGLYDMHGNVWEWCADEWHEGYNGAPSDGSVWLNGDNRSSRVIRGGSGFIGPRCCRSASRDNYNSDDSSRIDMGFRIVCVSPQDS